MLVGLEGVVEVEVEVEVEVVEESVAEEEWKGEEESFVGGVGRVGESERSEVEASGRVAVEDEEEYALVSEAVGMVVTVVAAGKQTLL